MDSLATLLISIAERACHAAGIQGVAARQAALIAVAEHYADRVEAAQQAVDWADTALARQQRAQEARRLQATAAELLAEQTTGPGA